MSVHLSLIYYPTLSCYTYSLFFYYGITKLLSCYMQGHAFSCTQSLSLPLFLSVLSLYNKTGPLIWNPICGIKTLPLLCQSMRWDISNALSEFWSLSQALNVWSLRSTAPVFTATSEAHSCYLNSNFSAEFIKLKLLID